MPLKLNVGLAKKIGQPDYGSLGASCSVEVELESSLLHSDVDGFQQRVRQAFTACRQAVQDELVRQQATTEDAGAEHEPNAAESNGHATPAGNNGNGNGHRATRKQIEYAQQLASQIRGLGVRRLEGLAIKMFGKPLANLSSLEGSGLIDVLKAIKAGTIDLEAALNGAAT